MHSVAKATIIVPIVIILIAAFLRFSNFTSQSNTTARSVVISVTPRANTPLVEDSQKELDSLLNSKSSSVSVDLHGPLVCTLADIDQDVKLFIHAKNIYFKLKEKDSEQYFLVKEGCAYKWENGQKEGIKVCNIAQYLSLAESLSRLPFFSTEMIFSVLPQFANSMGVHISDKNISSLIKSCQKQIIEPTVFDIPRNIQFIEQKISGTPQEFLK